MGDGRRIVTLGDSSGMCEHVGSARQVDTTSPRDARPFAVPGMVLLAATAIFEGYQWLQFIPGGSLRPLGLLFAVAVVPATWQLTRHEIGPRLALLRRLALASAFAVPVFGVLVLFGHGMVLHRCLGAASLLLAVAVLAVAAASERGDRPASTR